MRPRYGADQANASRSVDNRTRCSISWSMRWKVAQAAETSHSSRGRGRLKSPADIGYDTRRHLLFLPDFTEDRVEVRPVQ